MILRCPLFFPDKLIEESNELIDKIFSQFPQVQSVVLACVTNQKLKTKLYATDEWNRNVKLVSKKYYIQSINSFELLYDRKWTDVVIDPKKIIINEETKSFLIESSLKETDIFILLEKLLEINHIIIKEEVTSVKTLELTPLTKFISRLSLQDIF